MGKLPNVFYQRHNMEYQATAKYIRMSPRKVRLIADSIRNMNPEYAVIYLQNITKKAKNPMLKVVESALSNAKQKKVDISTLTFKTIETMGGPALKRWHAVSKGSAHAYKKRMTHVRVILTDAAHGALTTEKIEKKQVQVKEVSKK